MSIMSKIEVKPTENKTKGQLISVQCAACNRATKHLVLASYDEDGKAYVEYDRSICVDWFDYYQVVRCQGCETVSFRHVHWFSEDVEPSSENDGSIEQLYPKRSANSISPRVFYNVPSNLMRIYRELVDCFNNDSLIFCAIGLRALVEGICTQQGIKDGLVQCPAKGGGMQMVRRDNLKGRIAGLQEKGLLTQSSAQTLHQHRYLGNTAVHELVRPPKMELKLAIEIIEHTLEQLYEFPEKAAELKRAISKRNN
jgi:hypothetical protein